MGKTVRPVVDFPLLDNIEMIDKFNTVPVIDLPRGENIKISGIVLSNRGRWRFIGKSAGIIARMI